MNDIVRAASGALSTDVASKLLKGISESRASTPLAGGDPLLRLLKHGEWVYGQEDTEVLEGSLWAVNPLSIEHGYSCWSDDPSAKKNELLGEAMAPIYEPKPMKPEPKNGFPFKEQRAFKLKCINGDDTGVEAMHKVGSVGGMRAVDGLLADMQAQLATNPGFPCPVIELEVDSYQHTKWGRVFVPIFTLRGWADMNGNLSRQGELLPNPAELPGSITGQPKEAPKAAEPEPTQRRRRSTTSNANPTAAQPEPGLSPGAQRTADAVESIAPNPSTQAAAPQRTGMPRRRPGQR